MNGKQLAKIITRDYVGKLYESNALVAVDTHYIPGMLADLEGRKTRKRWLTDEDWELGYQALCQQGVDLLMPATSAIVESIDRLYRLLDTAFNGTQYLLNFDPISNTVAIDPPIPPTPSPAAPTTAFALRAQVARLRQLAENAATGQEFASDSALNGTVGLDFNGSWRARLEGVQGETGGFFGIGGTPVTLADLLKAGRINTPADQGLINDGFEEILTAVSQGGNIGAVLTDLLATGADAVTDGGVIAATLAAALAQAVTSATLAAQLDRIIAALDGGGLVGPSTNVIEKLESVETLLS